MGRKLQHFGLVAAICAGTIVVVAGCDDPTGLLTGGTDALASIADTDTAAADPNDRSPALDVNKPSSDPLAGVPAIPTRQGGPTSTAGSAKDLGPQPESARHLGAHDDVTAAVIEQLGGNPEANTMEQLAKLVADLRDGDGATETTIGAVTESAPEAVANGSSPMTVVVERTGIPDDSVLGERLIVHGRPAPDHGGVELVTVERHVLCRAGATDDGRCI